MEESKSSRTYKLVLLGNTNVGKSCIVHRFMKDEFLQDSTPTIGAQFVTKVLPVENGNSVRLEIWDTAGQERFKSLTPMYYKGAAVALVVYDVSNSPSFEGAKGWFKELQNHGSPNMVMALVGNKSDLQKVVSTETAREFASRHHLIFYEISAKTGENVNALFNEIARKVYALPPPVRRADRITVTQTQPVPSGSSGCCG